MRVHTHTHTHTHSHTHTHMHTHTYTSAPSRELSHERRSAFHVVVLNGTQEARVVGLEGAEVAMCAMAGEASSAAMVHIIVSKH